MMLFSPIIMSPPSAIILQAGWTIQFSPNEICPYNSVFEQIVIPVWGTPPELLEDPPTSEPISLLLFGFAFELLAEVGVA